MEKSPALSETLAAWKNEPKNLLNVKFRIMDEATPCSETWPDSPEIGSAQNVPVATLDTSQQHILAVTKANHGPGCTMGMSREALIKILPDYTLVWKTQFCAPSAKETVTNWRI